MWKQRKECANCSEIKKLHDRRGRCRYEQSGWLSVEKNPLPELRVKVLARRNREVFVAMRKIDVMAVGGDRIMWVTPYKRDGEIWHGIVEGITHFRALRPSEARLETNGRMTARHHAT